MEYKDSSNKGLLRPEERVSNKPLNMNIENNEYFGKKNDVIVIKLRNNSFILLNFFISLLFSFF